MQICPRTLLRKQVEKASFRGVEFKVGFEVEIVFMSKEIKDGEFKYGGLPISEGHAWSTARALHSDKLMDVIELIFAKLERAGLVLEQFHPVSHHFYPIIPLFVVYWGLQLFFGSWVMLPNSKTTFKEEILTPISFRKAVRDSSSSS